MSKKKKMRKYKHTHKAIDTQKAAFQAIVALDNAGVQAQKDGNALALAVVGLGWAHIFDTVFRIESGVGAGMEIAELQSETQRVINATGFSPNLPTEEEYDDED